MKLINSLISVNIVVIQIVEKVFNEVNLFTSILGGAGLLAIEVPTRVFDSSSFAGRSKPQFRVCAIAGGAFSIPPVPILADFIYSIHII